MAIQSMEPARTMTSAPVRCISVAGDGSVWAVDATGGVLRGTENVHAWTAVPVTATWVAVSADAGLVCVVMNGQASIAGLTDSTWTSLGSTGTTLAMVSIGTNPATVVWAVDTAGGVWTTETVNPAWQKVPITADAIAAAPDGSVIFVAAGQLASLLAVAGQGWVTTPIQTPELVGSVAVAGAAAVWFVGQTGTVYESGASGSWNAIQPPAPGAAARITCADADAVWLVLAGRLY